MAVSLITDLRFPTPGQQGHGRRIIHEGTEFLEESDTVSVFFSEKSGKIVGYRMMDIEKSRCGFEICKLHNVRKNALDFYIASKVGEIFATDKNAKVAIISADKDYQSVLDYWKPRLSVPNQLVRTKTLAKAISFVNGEGARKKMVNERMKLLDLETEFARYEERKRIATSIGKVFSGTEYEGLISQIVNLIVTDCRPKVLYLNSLKSFGKKSGTEVYRKIKDFELQVQ